MILVQVHISGLSFAFPTLLFMYSYVVNGIHLVSSLFCFVCLEFSTSFSCHVSSISIMNVYETSRLRTLYLVIATKYLTHSYTAARQWRRHDHSFFCFLHHTNWYLFCNPVPFALASLCISSPCLWSLFGGRNPLTVLFKFFLMSS